MASGNGGGSRIVGPTALRSALGTALLLGVACGGNSKTNKPEHGDGGNTSGGVSGTGAGATSGSGGEVGGGVGGGTATGGSGDEGGDGGDTDRGGDAGASGTDTGGNGGAAGGAGKGGAGPGGVGGSAGFIIIVGGASGTGGSTGPGLCASTGPALKGVLRDFQPTWMGVQGHPDFEPQVTKPSAINFFNMVETGIVQTRLDTVDRKPVYAHGVEGSNTTIGPAYFPSWFSDVPGVNVSRDYYLEFVESQTMPGIWVFDKAPFLPIDDGPACPFMPQTPCLMGNSRNYPTHNYALSYEFHTRFVYKTGLSFLFSGDDDVWVFVNGSLAIDLGGIHQRSEARLNLDAIAGLVVGEEYPLDFFWAERHVTQSNFRVETTLDLINCAVDVPR
jgi:fibro-slime domain-containing protein